MNDYYTNEPGNRILFSPENKQNPHTNVQGPILDVKTVWLSPLKTKQDLKKNNKKQKPTKQINKKPLVLLQKSTWKLLTHYQCKVFIEEVFTSFFSWHRKIIK